LSPHFHKHLLLFVLLILPSWCVLWFWFAFPWWFVLWSIFYVFIGHLCIFLELFNSFFHFITEWIFKILNTSPLWSANIFFSCVQSFCLFFFLDSTRVRTQGLMLHRQILYHMSHSSIPSFHLLDGVKYTNVYFDELQFIYFSFVTCAFGFIFKMALPNSESWGFTLFSSILCFWTFYE
jgi:hypothetical protein